MAYQTIATYVDGSFDKGIRRYTRTYKIFTDQTNLGPGQVATFAPDLLYQSWSHGTEVDLWALMKKKSAKPLGEQDGGFLWAVSCEYDSEPFEQGQGGTSPSGGPTDNSQTPPPARPWQISFSSNKTTKLLGPDDLDGKAVTASNGQPFDPPPEIPYARPTVSITAYKAINAESFANVGLYVNSINAGAWQGFAAKYVMCTDYQLQSQFEQGAWYWQKTVTFEVYDKPLNPVRVVDAGTFEVESAGLGTFKPFLDATGNPVSSPLPLNGAGRKLGAGNPIVYREFKGYREVNWNNII